MKNNNIHVLIQARLSSTRLPAKVMLDVAHYPLIVLVAKRASNSGFNVTIVTSDQKEDEVICNCAKSAGIPFFRGSLNNVLDRFYQATINLNDDEKIIRLTADNPLPDGFFLDALVEDFQKQSADYSGGPGGYCKLPYGLSAEVFTVKALREAKVHATDPAELEHCTVWIRNHKKCVQFEPNFPIADFSKESVTIDTFDDYVKIARLFSEIADPINTPWWMILGGLNVNR